MSVLPQRLNSLSCPYLVIAHREDTSTSQAMTYARMSSGMELSSLPLISKAIAGQ